MNIYDKLVVSPTQAIDLGALGVEVEKIKDGRFVVAITERDNHPTELANAPILPQEEYGLLKVEAPVVEVVQPQLFDESKD